MTLCIKRTAILGRRTAGPRCRAGAAPRSSRGQPPRSSRPASAGPVPPPRSQLDPVPAAGRSGPRAALLREAPAAPRPPLDRDPTVPFLAGSSRQRTTAPRAPLRPARFDSGFSPAPLAFPPAKFVPASRCTGVKTPGSRSGSWGEEKEGGGNKTAAVARTSAAPPRDVPGRARPGAGTAPASPRTPRPRPPRSVTAILGVRHLGPPCPRLQVREAGKGPGAGPERWETTRKWPGVEPGEQRTSSPSGRMRKEQDKRKPV
ncbi:translation initiation factor IF-2-like [Corvus hawaiiensis]|uniref:translation initiation factor IF-2-like n=1 Tax=Corvus hawaiiensis TaxID=134902 RepID=UPI0020187AEF|nr:translation initiation factor IF-2-like [Corvus hawaiiensis]